MIWSIYACLRGALRLVLIGCLVTSTGCFTSGLWSSRAGTYARVQGVQGAILDEATGQPIGLILATEGRGPSSRWQAVLPLGREGEIEILSGRGRKLSGLTLGELRQLHRQPPDLELLDAADDLRRQVRVRRRPAGAELLPTHTVALPYQPGYQILAYWPPGVSPEPPVRIEAEWNYGTWLSRRPPSRWHLPVREANLVAVVERPVWDEARPPHVVVIPATLQRTALGQVAAVGYTLVATPVTLVTDIGLVVTAPLWVPAFFLMFGFASGPAHLFRQPTAQDLWRVPLVWPEH